MASSWCHTRTWRGTQALGSDSSPAQRVAACALPIPIWCAVGKVSYLPDHSLHVDGSEPNLLHILFIFQGSRTTGTSARSRPSGTRSVHRPCTASAAISPGQRRAPSARTVAAKSCPTGGTRCTSRANILGSLDWQWHDLCKNIDLCAVLRCFFVCLFLNSLLFSNSLSLF